MTAYDLVREREDSASTAYHEFVLLVKHSPDSLFCFFEGKDAPYYHQRIKSVVSGRDLEHIDCKGKQRVLKVHELIRSKPEFRKYKKAFFIDRDFDESLKGRYTNLYETPCYSIENLYCSKKSFCEFLKAELRLMATSSEFQSCADCYDNLLRDFLSASLFFNEWYKLQKRKAPPGSIRKINLDTTLISEYVKVSLEKVENNYNLTKIRKKYPDADHVSILELREETEALKKTDLLIELRGKFVFSFLVYFIRLLLEDGRVPTKRKYLKRKISYNLDGSTALSLLSSYAQTPQTLVTFLKKYK